MTALRVIESTMKAPPYLATVTAGANRFAVDLIRMTASNTWTLAGDELRPWCLMLWVTAWSQVPCCSYPDDDEIIAAKIGMPLPQFQFNRAVLMRNWYRAKDGRLYHPVLTEVVTDMLDRRAAWAHRQKHQRVKAEVTPESRVTHAGVTGESRRSHAIGVGVGVGVNSNSTTKSKTRSRREPVAPPDWLPKEAWQKWARHRGSKLTPAAVTLQTNKLAKLRDLGHNPAEMIDLAIESGWATFYPPRPQPARSGDAKAAVTAEIWKGAKDNEQPTDITGESERIT